MTKTAQGLADYAKAQLGRPYWWGTFGQRASTALLEEKRRQYPGEYAAYGSETAGQMGQKVHDCVGLIKGYLWCDTPDGPPKYNAAQDVAVSGLYNSCTRRGDITSMPETPGLCVFQSGLGHVGVYIGGGEVIEAMGHAYGVVKTQLRSRNWAFWGMPKWIEYGDTRETAEESYTLVLPQLEKGCTGEPVRAVQRLLIARGYGCGAYGADGEFGTGTENSVKEYQKDSALESDGIVGRNTMSGLLGLL